MSLSRKSNFVNFKGSRVRAASVSSSSLQVNIKIPHYSSRSTDQKKITEEIFQPFQYTNMKQDSKFIQIVPEKSETPKKRGGG